MAGNTPTEDYVQLKLLVNEETNKVVFAESGKDFVDILCSFLTLPLGTIARLSQMDSSMGPVKIGCLNTLYQSVADLDECLYTKTSKEMLLYPRNSSEDYCGTLKLNIDDLEPIEYFMCANKHCGSDSDFSYSSHYLHSSIDGKCVRCWNRDNRPIFLRPVCKGFVNSVTTFVITDDLVIKPISMVYTSFSLLQNSGIITSSAKEMTVNVTKDKVLDLLKCTLISMSPLTDVFLGRKPSIPRYSFFACYFENNNDIQMTLQLVIRKSNGKILFAHGEQDFADLLLSFLTFPLGGSVRKFGGYGSMGSIGGLYKSIFELDVKKYLMSEEAKKRLVDPHLASEFNLKKKILPVLPIKKSHKNFYCYYHGESYRQSIINDQFFITDEYRSDDRKRVTFNLGEGKALERSASDEGFVKGPRTYLATDDLFVGPSSPISALLLINRLQVPLDDLKEKVVTIGMKECLRILEAALTSTSALTNGLSYLLTKVKEEK